MMGNPWARSCRQGASVGRLDDDRVAFPERAEQPNGNPGFPEVRVEDQELPPGTAMHNDKMSHQQPKDDGQGAQPQELHEAGQAELYRTCRQSLPVGSTRESSRNGTT